MSVKKIILFLLMFSLIHFFLEGQSGRDYEIISVKKDKASISKLRNMNLDILVEWEGRIYVVCEIENIFRLRKENIPFKLETFAFRQHDLRDFSGEGGANGDFHSYAELEEDLMTLERSYPNLAKVIDIGDSLEGRNIYALKISDNVSLHEDEAEFILIGCHHAREWISVEVPFYIGKYLVENYGRNQKIKYLVQNSEIWIIPLLNPDGLEYSIHFYRYWRKNRRDNRTGSYGVDLNRNYGYKWGHSDSGSSPNSWSSVYRGASPFSEPETKAVRDLFARRDFQALISYHNYSQIILYPWGYTLEPTAHDGLFEEMAAEMSRRMKSVNGNTYKYGHVGDSLYLSNGDTIDWAYGVYGIPSFTIELPPLDMLHGGFFNAEEEIDSVFRENLPAALYLIEWAIKEVNSK